MTQPHLDQRFDSAKIAGTALNSEDGSYGDFIHLKPAHTPVKLYRDRDKLEIRWRDLDREKIAKIDAIAASPLKLLGWVIFVGFCSFFVHIILIPTGINIFLYLAVTLLYSIPLLGVALVIFCPILAAVIKIFIASKSIDYRLTIDDEYIYRSKAQSSQHKSKTISQHSRSGIEILAYNPGYVFDKYLDGTGTVTSRGTVVVNPKLY